jgi:hypothetical protein
MMIGKNILGAKINDPLPPVDAIAGVAMLESVVPKVIAAVPVPVFKIATRNAKVGVFGISCRADDAAVVRSKRYVGDKILRESMINPYG